MRYFIASPYTNVTSQARTQSIQPHKGAFETVLIKLSQNAC